MNTDTLQVAQTILQQLGGAKFVVMTGATSFAGGTDALSMRIGRNAAGITAVKITLTPLDLYTITYYRMRGSKVEIVREDENVYAEDLQGFFTRATGLDTHL